MYNKDKIISTMHEIFDESKQISPYVVIAQPQRDAKEIPAQNFDTGEKNHLNFSGYSHGFASICGEKVDVARNYLMEQVLNSDAKYLFFIGEDTVVPIDAFLKLHDTAEKNPDTMVTGVYYFKMAGPMIMIRENNYIYPPNVDPGQVFEAWQTGLDCALIPVSILKALKDEDPEIPFCCIGYGLPDLPFIGEDNFFQYRLRKNGFKTLVNTDVQALHCDILTGQYTAHPSIDLNNYLTNIKMTTPFTVNDREFLEKRWNRSF